MDEIEIEVPELRQHSSFAIELVALSLTLPPQRTWPLTWRRWREPSSTADFTRAPTRTRGAAIGAGNAAPLVVGICADVVTTGSFSEQSQAIVREE